MAALSSILRSAGERHLAWWCPGCNTAHVVAAAVASDALPRPDPDDPDWTPPAQYYGANGGAWTWNGSARKPSLMPSLLVTYPGPDAGQGDAPPAVCHSFVVDGQMQFLSDSTHALAGKTVPIPDWPRPDWGGV